MKTSRAVLAAWLALAVGLAEVRGEELRRIVYTRYPALGMWEFAMDDHEGLAVDPAGLCFLGDSDGDGRDELGGAVGKRSDPQFGGVVILYGLPRSSMEPRFVVADEGRSTLLRYKPGDPEPVCGYTLIGPAGDLDGDGLADMMLTFPYSCYGGARYAGLVAFVRGTRGGLPRELLPEEVQALVLSPDSGRVVSRKEGHYLGWGAPTASPPDLNGDGRMDLPVSATARGTENGGTNACEVYVVFGGSHLLGREWDVSEVGSRLPGVVLRGAYGSTPTRSQGDSLGGSMSSAGDFNGDGYDDLAVGAFGAYNGAGAVYLLLGGPSLPAAILCARPGGHLVEIRGPGAGVNGAFGWRVSIAGDVDRDGYCDLLIAMPDADSQTSWVYLVYGVRDPPAVMDVSGPSVRKATFFAKNPLAGSSTQFLAQVGRVGDWNGDGFADFLFSGFLMVGAERLCGEVFLVYGRKGLEGSWSVDAVGTPALPGLAFVGAGPFSVLGLAGSGGDFDGDGRADFAMGMGRAAECTRPTHPRRIFVVFGGSRIGEELFVGGVRPAEGSVVGGYEVQVFGTGFRGDERVWFGGSEAHVREIVSSGEMRVYVPRGKRAEEVAVRVWGSGGEAALEGGFRYVDRRYMPDLLVDPDWLRARGYRTLLGNYRVFPPVPRGVTQSLRCFSGDLNGDGIADLAVGAPYGVPEGWSRVAVVFGTRLGFPAEVDLEDIAGYGTSFEGDVGLPNFATYVAFPGDLDGDGHADVGLNPYVIFGREEWPELVELRAELDAGRAVALAQGACERRYIAGAGDVSGAGRRAMVASCSRVRVWVYPEGVVPPDVGENYPTLVLGDLENVNTTICMRNPQPLGPRSFGTEVSGAGDVNGDSFGDFVVGAAHAECAFYIVLGGDFNFDAVPIRELLAVGRAVMVEVPGHLGYCGEQGTAAALGDFNGDTLDDVALGAPGSGMDFEGVTYVLFGSREFGKSVRYVDLVTAGPERVMRIVGARPYDWSGWVEGLGDVNGDGYGDLGIVSQYHPLFHGKLAGPAYVVFGARELPWELELSAVGILGRGVRILPLEGHEFWGANGGIAAGDFDGDGRGDVALGEWISESGRDLRRRVVVIFSAAWPEVRFVRGEVNGDGRIDLSDAVYALGYLFLGGEEPGCEDAADVDDSGAVGITDAIYLLTHLFLGGPEPPPPYPACRVDPGADGIPCAEAPPCE